MKASLKQALIQAVVPRGFEYLGKRKLGAGNRLKIQALQWSKYPLRTLTAFNPGYSPRLERAIAGIEGRILQLAEGVQKEKVRTEEIFEHILKGLNDGIIIMGSDGKMLQINQKLLDLTGYSLEEGLGKSPVDFVQDDFKGLVLESIQKVLGGESISPTDVMIVKKNGDELSAEFTASLLRISSGEKMISVVVRDITERKQTEKALIRLMERYRDLFENAPMGFHNVSPEGKIMDVNKKWLEVLGYGREEVIGKSIFDFIVPEQRKNAKARFRARLERWPLPKKEGDRKYLRKDGTTIYAQTHDTVVRGNNGAESFVQTSFLDITELRKAERREAELAAALDIFNGVADHFGQVFGVFDFYADPQFNGLGQIMRKYEAVDFSPVLKSLKNIKDAADVSINTIDLLRDYRHAAKAARGLLIQAEPVSIYKIIQESLADFENQGKKIIFESSVDLPKMAAHQEWLSRAVSYFIQNALEAIDRREDKEEAYVRLDVKRDGVTVAINISDNGVRHQDLSLDILGRPPLSHGVTYMYIEQLKLATALKYVEALGGACRIEGDKTRGTTFSISLPVDAGSEI